MKYQVHLTKLNNDADLEQIKTLLGISDFELDNLKENLPSQVLTIDSEDDANKICSSLNNFGCLTEIKTIQTESSMNLDDISMEFDSSEEEKILETTTNQTTELDTDTPMGLEEENNQEKIIPTQEKQPKESDKQIEDVFIPTKDDNISLKLSKLTDKSKQQEIEAQVKSETKTSLNKKKKSNMPPYLTESIVILMYIFIFFALSKIVLNKDDIEEQQKVYKDYIDTVFENIKDKHVSELANNKKATDRIETNYTSYKNRNEIVSYFKFLNTDLMDYKLVLLGKKPEPLTDEQIINNVQSPPWLDKISFSNMLIDNSVDGFTIQGQAKIVIKNESDSTLINANAVITGKFDKSEILSIDVLLNKGFLEIPKEDFKFEYVGTDLNIFIRKKFHINKLTFPQEMVEIEQKLSELAY